MKAKEYYEKYKEGLASEDEKAVENTAYELLMEMSNECKIIMEQRKCFTDRAAVAVLKEMNGRWNAVVRFMIKDTGKTPLKEDGFIRAWETKIPELKKTRFRRANYEQEGNRTEA